MKPYLVYLAPKASERGLHTLVTVVTAKSAMEAKRNALRISDQHGNTPMSRTHETYTVLKAVEVKESEIYYL